MSQMTDTIQALCQLPGPSGWEDAVRDYLCAEAKPYADELTVDPLGSVLVFKRGRKSPRKPVMLTAHMDEGRRDHQTDRRGRLPALCFSGQH